MTPLAERTIATATSAEYAERMRLAAPGALPRSYAVAVAREATKRVAWKHIVMEQATREDWLSPDTFDTAAAEVAAYYAHHLSPAL